jgi:hypothetical protein
VTKGANLKEYMYEFMLTKLLIASDEYVSSQEQGIGNELRVVNERLKQADADVLRYRQELTKEKEQFYQKMSNSESERV